MAALIVPNAAQMRLIWSLSGQLYALNVMGVVNSGGVAITQALANTLGTAIKAALTSSTHGASVHTTVALANIGIRDIRTANAPEYIDTGGATAGTGTGDILPLQVALCITLRTAFSGRTFRGRCYLPGWNETSNGVTGVVTSTANAVGFITAIKSTLVSNSLDLGVIHRPTESPLPVTSGFITPVTSIVARDAVWDTQRRRAVPGV